MNYRPLHISRMNYRPLHIRGIGFGNFKVFKHHQDFDFAPITIFTGTNNSGKSSVINGLRLLKENFTGSQDFSSLILGSMDLYSLSDRYGNLQQFLHMDENSEIQKRTFTFSNFFQVDSTHYKSTYEVLVKEGIKKEGKLQTITIDKLQGKGDERLMTNVISIDSEERTKVNFKTIFEELKDGLLKKKEYYSNKENIVNALKQRRDTYDNIKNQLELAIEFRDHQVIFNSFLSILPDDKEYKLLLETIISDYYKSSLDNAYAKFENDWLEYINEELWGSITYDIFMEYVGTYFPLSKDYFSKKNPNLWINFLFNNISNPKTGTVERVACLKGPLSRNSILVCDNNNTSFTTEVLLPLIAYLKTRVSEIQFETHTSYDRLLADSISKIIDEFHICRRLSYGEMIMLNTERMNLKRVFSLNEKSSFSDSIAKIHYYGHLDFVNRWLQEFGIGDAIEVKYEEDTKNFKPYIRKGKDTLLADMGFGTSQLIPLILSLIPPPFSEDEFDEENHRMREPKVVIVEEPEANLHPALQSKLADMLVEATTKHNIQLIVETHSEYLIRKLQYLTANSKSELQSVDTIIYYFYPPDKIPEGEQQVEKIQILEDGSLSKDFGTGFFDEADKIAISIFGLQQQAQKN